jgi:large subunit ribosomal protein LP0
MEAPPQMSARKQRKHTYRQRLIKLLSEYKNLLIISVDNVGSRQMQGVRLATRGKAEMLMGKNTIIRKVLRDEAEKNPKLLNLLPHINGNMGFVFSNIDLNELRKEVCSNQVPAAAKTGQFSPIDVLIDAGPTGLDPGQTSFFQALNISTKISKGAIEIMNEVKLISAGERVTSSAVALLSRMGRKPFFFGIVVKTVYEDGSVYDAKVLDLTPADLTAKFMNGVRHIAAIGLEIGYPTAASIPHSMANCFKTMLSISLATEYTFDESKIFKDMLANPGAFSAAAPAAKGGAAAPAAAAAAAPDDDDDDDEDDGGFGGGLFDD